MTDYRNHSGPGDCSPPEDAPVYECQSCHLLFATDDAPLDEFGLRLCPNTKCGSDDVVRY